MKLDETYNPTDVESRWYDFWQESGFFEADEKSEKPPFTIVIPPPNVTGRLHMGHALFVTLQDILIRWKRMEGFETLWLPGTDHAGIATQMMVVKELAKSNISRHDLGREKFVEKVWEWKEEKGGQIIDQMKKMGASCDWERERFTMDDGLTIAVREAFVQMYEDGLIYRAERMVDWDPELKTVLSNLEVLREEEPGHFWYLKYPLADGSGEIIVGTTRPETMLGDTAVAVHPDDERYKDMIGKMIQLPLTGRQIPIIADSILPDPEKGTGAVKVTPAHDPNDFECGNRHDLERIVVIDFDAKMTDRCPDAFIGLDRYAARKKVVADFKALGLLDKIDETTYSPGRGERSGVIVEPLPMLQWFVNTEPLAKKAIEAVESGATKIVPAMWKKTYDHFMYNIRPWCISRQLWWGHQIPAWYCNDCDEITVDRVDPTCCSKCESTNIKRDEDVLDTWFSSGLWPFSTLGWPEKTQSLEKFYPTQVMETGSDILFFWVARMLMMGTYFMGEAPFSHVFLHPMVRDDKGKKMSKTTGNVIDPLHLIYGAEPVDMDPIGNAELIKQYPDGVDSQGADALRFTLAIYAAQGRDIKLDIKRTEGYRAFLNKLWNASKFTLMNLEDYSAGLPNALDENDMSIADKWIVHRLGEVAEASQNALEEFRFNDYANELYHFVWHEFCDWYIEYIKPALYNDKGDDVAKLNTQKTMLFVLERILRLLHPISPFITEDIWKSLPLHHAENASIMVAAFPKDPLPRFPEAAKNIAIVEEFITSVRKIRGETGVKPSIMIEEIFLVGNDKARLALEEGRVYIERLAKISKLTFVDQTTADAMQHVATAVSLGTQIRIPLKGLIDVEEEVARLEKELGKIESDIAFVSKKLSNERFIANAPDAVVAKEREKISAFEIEQNALRRSLQELQELANS